MIANFVADLIFVRERKEKIIVDEEDNNNYLESDEIHISSVVQRFFFRFGKVILVGTVVLGLGALLVDIGKLMYLLT